MRDHSQHVQVCREEAIELLLNASDFSPATEMVSVANSVGRVLATDVLATLDMPNALTCRMDSVALRWSDFEGLPEGEIPDTSAWARGEQWEFANTGIAMPAGFDTAIVIEHVQVSDDEQHIVIDAAPSAQFAGTSAPGSRVKQGDVLAKAGTVVEPAIASEILSGGVSQVAVIAKPTVAFIPTGNELVVGGGPLPQGKNYETNSLVVSEKIKQWGGIPVVLSIVPDNKQLIVDAVKKACEIADIVVLNAGSSKGSDDWNVEMLEQVGEVLYHQTSHGPGHHSSGAVVDATPVVGISGPARGAAFTTDFYLWPLMRKWFGQDPYPKKVRVRLAGEFPAGGPGPHRAQEQGKKPAGEDRPMEETEPGAKFFAIRMMIVSQAEDGVLEGRPCKAMPGALGGEAVNAYYALPRGGGAPDPHVGDFIEVELRP